MAVLWDAGGMAEHQPYDVIAEHPGFELRRYPPHVVADVEVAGSFESAGTTAFRPLVGYISKGGVAMTAPVLQQAVDELEDVTAAGSYRVSFVMPSGSNVASLPIPADSRVHIREVDEHTAAAARFSGRWTAGSFRKHAADLRSAVVAAGWRPSGPVRWARFDPPWTPWFLRHNEVVLPVVQGR
jgi:hypothetical protein